jgi:putative transposase
MDGKGRATDNIYIERFWRTLKQDWVYLNPVDACPQLGSIIDRHQRVYKLLQ